MTNRVASRYHSANFQRLIGSDAASIRLRHLTLPDGERDSELLSVALTLSDGTVAEIRSAADGIRLVLAPTAYGPQDMAGLGRITEHPLRRQGTITTLRHILGNRSTELILTFADQPSLSLLNAGDTLHFREVIAD